MQISMNALFRDHIFFRDLLLFVGTYILAYGLVVRWKVARITGWIKPKLIDMAIFASLFVDRCVSQLGVYELLHVESVRWINAGIFFVDACLTVAGGILFLQYFKRFLSGESWEGSSKR